jgi:hypothetical protein
MERMVGTVVVDDDDGKAVELIMERLPGKKNSSSFVDG